MNFASGITQRWDKLKPKCKGCIYLGGAIPCEYILVTGHSPKSQGAHIDPEGPGGCELKETKQWRKRSPVPPMPQTNPIKKIGPPAPQTSAKPKKKRSKLDTPEAMALYEDGKSDGEIAKFAGVTVQTVFRWRKARKLPTKWSPQKK